MKKYEVELDENQEKIVRVLLKLDNQKTVGDWIKDTIYDSIEQSTPQIIGEYLEEIKQQTGWIKDFKEAGITKDEIDEAVIAAKELGINLEKNVKHKD